MLITPNEAKTRTLAWLEAVRICGGEKKLGMLIEVKQSTISTWINQPSRNIPLDKALLTEEITKIGIDRLLPNLKRVNAYLKKRNEPNKLISQELLTNKILITDAIYLPYPKPDRHIIIDTGCNLIAGLIELQQLQKNNQDKANVIILDLIGLLLGTYSLDGIINKLLISERIAIGLRLKKLLGDRQGQRTDLIKSSKTQINHDNQSPLNTIWHQVSGKTAALIAKIIGFASQNTYIRAEQVYFNGCQELINALDQKQIFIARAATIAKFSKDQQPKFMQLKKGEKLCPELEQ